MHLMVERPERHIEDFAKAGADHITIHAEATPHVHYALQAVRGRAARPGSPSARARPWRPPPSWSASSTCCCA